MTTKVKRDGGTKLSDGQATDAHAVPSEPERIVEKVRERYGRIAEGGASGCCGGEATSCGTAGTDVARQIGYDERELASVPGEANLGLGCGAPVALLDLRHGETVLDLGSGPGLDAFLAAREVGPGGRVIGVDMTPAMLERARAGASAAGLAQVEFRRGRLEALPVEDASVDAVTSNCVINLVPDKAAVFREIARVLRPGGRLVIADIVLDGTLPEIIASDLLAYVGCIAGASRRADYFALVAAAGLTGVTLVKDVDYLAAAGYTLPPELQGRMERTGVRPRDLAGLIRSVTFRAFRPAR